MSVRVLRRVVHRAVDRADRDGERGSSAVELVIVLPVVLLLLSTIVLGGRLALSQLAVDSAAGEAARSASLARSPVGARSGAEASARASLANQSIDCRNLTVDVDTQGFATAVGTPAEVTARVTCDVNLAGLALPGIPTSKSVTSEVTSPLDTYRER